MNKSMLVGVLIGVGGALAGGALAGYAVWSKEKRPEAREVAQVPPPAQYKPAETSKLFEAPTPIQQVVNIEAPEKEKPAFARVVDVDPVTQTVSTPQEQCHDEQVVHQKEPRDENRIAGTVIGGVVGGALGNRIGKGRGRDAATVAGALAGGYAGNRVQKNMQEGETYTTTERRCSTTTHTSKKTVGYKVTYLWNGETKTVRMKQRPGDRLPVENGEVLLVSAKNLAKYE